MIRLVLIVPCYNEEEVLGHSFSELYSVYRDLTEKKLITPESRICFVDDGSSDDTWKIIENLQHKHREVIGIRLSRNFGHQNALVAGLETLHNRFDAYVTIDADLQDDTGVIKEMVEKYREGYRIVYGVRNDRKADSLIYRKTVQSFYRLMQKLGDKSIYNHADFRLVDNTVLTEFLRFPETNLYLRGMFPGIGFRNTNVYYARKERKAGTSKYPLSKLVALAWEGITSFSSKPLQLVLVTGVLLFLVAIVISVWALVEFIAGNTLRGWFSTIIPLTLFGGIQMLSLGIIGEYIGKLYLEVKNRPRFIIEEIKGMDGIEKA